MLANEDFFKNRLRTSVHLSAPNEKTIVSSISELTKWRAAASLGITTYEACRPINMASINNLLEPDLTAPREM